MKALQLENTAGSCMSQAGSERNRGFDFTLYLPRRQIHPSVRHGTKRIKKQQAP